MSAPSEKVKVTLEDIVAKYSDIQSIAAKFGFSNNVKLCKHSRKNILCFIIEEADKHYTASRAKRTLCFIHEAELLFNVATISLFASNLNDKDKTDFDKNIVSLNDKPALVSLFGRMEDYIFHKIDKDHWFYSVAASDRKLIYDRYMQELSGLKPQFMDDFKERKERKKP